MTFALLLGGLAGGCNAISGIERFSVGEVRADGGAGGTGSGGDGHGGAGGAGGGVGGAGGGGEAGSGGKGGGLPSGEPCKAHADCASEACLDSKCAAIVQIGAGSTHACARTDSGHVHCWGANEEGQIGDGSIVFRLHPTEVQGLLGKATQIAVGSTPSISTASHTCALIENGLVQCWGRNYNGQLGINSINSSNVPKQVQGLSGAVEIAAGGAHTCARTMDGTVFCWGLDSNGQLGNGKQAPQQLMPVQIPELKAEALALGGAHSCAILAMGGLACWGANASGQLGLNSKMDAAAPTPVPMQMQMPMPAAIKSVAAGRDFTCARPEMGPVLCWGENDDGNLGLNTTTDAPVPTPVPGLQDVINLDLGADSSMTGGGHACAVVGDHKLFCWGANNAGQLGLGDNQNNRLTPTPVDLPDVVEVATGSEFTCARLVTGAIRCWGRNHRGQLGNGATSDHESLPVPVVWP
jgi:alpha-tubulin suppressor-like RCC1 family protein